VSYPDVIHAGALRLGDRIYTERATTRQILATCWKPGYSFIGLSVEGEECSRSMPIGRALYVLRECDQRHTQTLNQGVR
jgi:hypothetical protein